MESIENKIEKFLNIDHECIAEYNYGIGYGKDYGSGYGNACGWGSVDGDGSGCGYSSGMGYSDQSGNGKGSMYTCGTCDEDCSGLGCGEQYYDINIKTYNGQQVYFIDRVLTLIDSIQDNVAKGFIINSDKTTTPCYIVRIGNKFAHGETYTDAMRKHIENI